MPTASKKTTKKSSSAKKKTVKSTSRTSKKVAKKVKSSAGATKDTAGSLGFASTEEIDVQGTVIEQVIGQDDAVDVVKKAAVQGRHVLLIGEPGTGKSMLGVALAQILPKEKLVDVVAFANPNDENNPFVRVVPAGKGRELAAKSKVEQAGQNRSQTIILFLVLLVITLVPWISWRTGYISDIIYGASLIASMLFLIGFMMLLSLGKRLQQGRTSSPKVIVDNFGRKQVPFYDATGSIAGALLGDVLHDPFQSGGLGTPAHERLVAGMIHKAHMGVLFIDEIATLGRGTQQELLSALQDGKFSITGQSERSAGAMVRSEPVPCKFILVAAGNYDSITHMHPALRSRIRGYGYEVYMKDTMEDTSSNQQNVAKFIAQEVRKDKKIPHFSAEAVALIIEEARRRSNRKNHLTLRFRELGGLVRAAGDLALADQAKLVTADHVRRAKHLARPLEKQIADKIIEFKREYEVIRIDGAKVGRVNGLAVLGGGSSFSGIVSPIEAQVAKGHMHKNQINATGQLKETAQESVVNVTAMIERWFGADTTKDLSVYLQFVQSTGVDGDSASIAIAAAIISAFKNVPIRQDTAMTGSLSVRGDVLPIGGVNYKIEAAAEAGIKRVIIPQSNVQDLVLDKNVLDKVQIIPVQTLVEVLKEALDWTDHKSLYREILKIAKTN